MSALPIAIPDHKTPNFVGVPVVASPRHDVDLLLAEIIRLESELARLRGRNEALERLVDQDPLIPIANRRAFMAELARAQARSRRSGRQAAVIYVDLDNMKTLNDRWGHAAGDAALHHLVATLTGALRETDMLARLGGDEFAILLVDTAVEAALAKSRSLVARVARSPLHWHGTDVSLSISTGIAALSGTKPADAVLEEADRAMYRAKQRQKAQRPA